MHNLRRLHLVPRGPPEPKIQRPPVPSNARPDLRKHHSHRLRRPLRSLRILQPNRHQPPHPELQLHPEAKVGIRILNQFMAVAALLWRFLGSRPRLKRRDMNIGSIR